MKAMLTSAALILMTGTAFAADAVVYEQPPEAVVIEPGFTWTGLYIGANVGYSWGDFDHTFDLAPVDLGGGIPGVTDTFEADADGITGGAQIGYNWQVNNFVFGVEADIQASDVQAAYSQTAGIGPVEVTTEVGTDLDWFGTARLRLGYVPTERLMLYGTGGFAFGRTTSFGRISAVIPFIGPFDEQVSESKTRTGWAAGAGAEYALTNNWTIKTEYLYTDLGEEEYFNFNEDPINFTLASEVKFHTVRVGVNYKF
jgi:outer membrane immunogenic protein